MAKQDGFGMIVGTIGGLTFYKRGSSYFVREAQQSKGKRVLSEEELVRRFENAAEFKLATKHSWGIRTALRGLVYGIMEQGNSGKLSGKLHSCIRTNPVGERGKRKLNPATLARFLAGHEFNSRSTLPINFDTYEWGGLTVDLNRVSDVVEVTFGAHNSLSQINAPGLADSYSFVAGVARWDGTEEDVQGSVRCGWRGDWRESGQLAVAVGSVPDTVLSIPFPAVGGDLVVVVAGVRYWKNDGTVDGFWLRLQSCLRVVGVFSI